MSLKGDSRERLSKTAPTPKTIEKCLISCWVIGEEGDEMAEAGEISEGRVQKISHKQLGLQDLCANLVPHLLITDRKQMNERFSQQCLGRLNRHPTNFVMNETHLFTPTWQIRNNCRSIAYKSVVHCQRKRSIVRARSYHHH
ncbi:hypothetical protein TNCV_844221 [Trichonephila clavipes]|nr:hypothetical protein TNCV_844221 [Trichonephila clavipes]